MNALILKKGFIYLIILMSISFISSYYVCSTQSERDPDAEIPEYTIGIEDVLDIFVWKEEELSMNVVVRPDGKISFPLVSDIAVEGLTCQQLEEKIRGKLLKYLKEPKVSVIAKEINSFKVSVLGEVNSQGVYMLRSPLRFLEIIAMAEGLTEFANKTNVLIIRKEGRKQRRITVDYGKIISGLRPDDNIFIKPGDTIIVQ